VSIEKKFKKITLTSLVLNETSDVRSQIAGCEHDLSFEEFKDLVFPMSGVFVKSIPKLSIILNPDGSIWIQGSLYLLSRALDYNPADYKTIESIARDLVDFRSSLNEHDIDYLVFPLNLLKRPTYAYSSILNERAKRKDSPEVERRKLSCMIKFYKWLKREDPNFQPAYAMWIDRVRHIKNEDSEGRSVWREVTSTDLSISHSAAESIDVIKDGGKLRPLQPHETESILKALVEDDNIEMMLMFAIALTSGARIQTVGTLRVSNIYIRNAPVERLIPTKAGRGELVESKRNKPIRVYIPYWIHKRLEVYVKSLRYKSRLELRGGNDNSDPYIFLTRAGRPYYMSKADEEYCSTPETIDGGAVRVYISRLRSKILKAEGKNINFSFHDLRATFGMNLLNELMEQVDAGKRTLSSALNYLRKRMSHSDLKTTMGYLRYYEDVELAYEAQTRFEDRIERMMSEFE